MASLTADELVRAAQLLERVKVLSAVLDTIESDRHDGAISLTHEGVPWHVRMRDLAPNDYVAVRSILLGTYRTERAQLLEALGRLGLRIEIGSAAPPQAGKETA